MAIAALRKSTVAPVSVVSSKKNSPNAHTVVVGIHVELVRALKVRYCQVIERSQVLFEVQMKVHDEVIVGTAGLESSLGLVSTGTQVVVDMLGYKM